MNRKCEDTVRVNKFKQVSLHRAFTNKDLPGPMLGPYYRHLI